VNDTGTPAENAPMTRANVAVVAGLYEAFERGDLQAIFESFHPEAVIYQSTRLPWGGHYQGHDGLADFLRKLTEAVQSKVRAERYIDDEEGHVVAVGYTSGKVLATGGEFELPGVQFWTVQDGKVTRFESYIDTAPMRAALGI